MSVFQPIDVRDPERRRRALMQRLAQQLTNGGSPLMAGGAQQTLFGAVHGRLGGAVAAGRAFRAAGDFRAAPRPNVVQAGPHVPDALRSLLGPGGSGRSIAAGELGSPGAGAAIPSEMDPQLDFSLPARGSVPASPLSPDVGSTPVPIPQPPVAPPNGAYQPVIDPAPATPIAPVTQSIPLGNGLYLDPETLLVHGAPRGSFGR